MMLRKLNILGLIPARGGSKGIARKSIAPLAGRPLIAYTAEAALGARSLSRVLLSTDDPGIAQVGRSLGLETPFLRPAKFAQDHSPAIDVIRHALDWLAEHERYYPDAVALLQPTSPLRRAKHIDAAAVSLIETGADSIVSVVAVPHQYNPVSVLRLQEGRLVPFIKGPLITRRQDKPLVFARNGPALVLTRRDVLIEKGLLYGADCRPLVMDIDESTDIDEPRDLEYVERLLCIRPSSCSAEQKDNVCDA
jgi:CMP-N,N'-diacetyllegionaminic acid synthase